MINIVAIACVIAGGATIVFAFVSLVLDRGVRAKIETTVASLNEAASTAASTAAAQAPPAAPAGGGGLGNTAVAQGTALNGAAEYIKALGELAGNLSKVSQAVAALLISTIFFGLAVSLVAVNVIAG